MIEEPPGEQTAGDAMASSRRELLATVGELYYLEGCSQDEIAGRLNTSRSTVSRLLHEGRRKGVVEIRVHRTPPACDDMAAELHDRYGLRHAVVVAGGDTVMTQRMGARAAELVERWLPSGGTMAISYGRAVHATVQALRTSAIPALRMVQMAGLAGANNPLVDGWELVRTCAERLGASYQHLHAPLRVESRAFRDAIFEEPHARRVLEAAASADIGVVGIGSLDPTESSLVRAGHLTPDELRQCVEVGSVGYINGQHYDSHGRPIPVLNELTISLPLERLHEIGCVIGVAGGADKAPGILGALRGGLVDVLITDEQAAAVLMAPVYEATPAPLEPEEAERAAPRRD